MPFYTYQCTDCGKNFDIRATISEKEAGLKPECPHCHSQGTRQTITAGISLPGSEPTGAARNGCSGPGCCG